MAHSLKPGTTHLGVVHPPNQTGLGGNRAKNSYLPLSGSTPSELAPHHVGGDRRNGCFSLDAIDSPVNPPDHRFNVDCAKMPQPPSAIEPGTGDIPVNPWNPAGRPNRVTTDSDIPREPRR